MDVFGTPTLMDVMHLQAEFSTDYEVEEWNKSSADRSYIATTTIKPTVTSSYGWSWQGAELSGAIPYRWGFAEGEQAWVQAQLANPTEAEADKVALDVSASGITADPLAGARGFLPNGVAIEGFRDAADAPATGEGALCGADGAAGGRAAVRHESGTIEGVELYAFNNLPTEGDAVVPVRSFDAEALTKWIDNGVLTIPDTEFPQDAPVALVRVKYAHLSAQSSMVVRMLGYMNTHGAPAAGSANHTYQNSITTSAHFFPVTDAYGDGIERKSSATVLIGQLGTATTARSFKPADVRPTDGPIESTDGGSIEVAAHAENVGYRFSFQNTSHARSDESTITLDVQGIARRGAEDEDNTVRGFRTKTVEVSADILKLGTNRDGSTAFEKALLFFLDPTTGEQAGGAFEMDAQAVQSALASADSFTLTVGEGMLADRAGQYLSKIELRYASIDPVTSGATLGIELTGKADWYDDHVAAQTFEQKGAFDTRIPSSQKAVLRVERPAAELHTYVQYATADDGTECEDPNYTNRGGSDDNTRTQVVVPYDRDFTMWATVQNERNVSVLDDLDVVLTMPLKYETGIKQEDGSTVDAWTGFHVTSFTVNQDILSCFPQGQVGTIRLTGYAPDADANASAVAKELRPVADPVRAGMRATQR